MQWQMLFFSMAPVVAFMAFRERGPLRRGVGAALVVAAVELAYNSWALGRLEPFSLLSGVLFALFGALAVRRGDERLFRLQPVVLEVALAGVFLYYGLVRDVALFAVIVKDVIGIDAILPAYQRGYAEVYATTLSRSLPYMLLVHAALTAWTALAASRWTWFHVRVFGFYAMLVVLFVAERLLRVNP